MQEIWDFLKSQRDTLRSRTGKVFGTYNIQRWIRIDPAKIEAILTMTHPRNIRELQSFLGKINFLRRFISNLAELIRELNNMLRKDATLEWTVEAKQSFETIKEALTKAPVLISPDFNKDFIIFSFALEHTIAAVLLQNNKQGYKQPIAFFSKSLRDATLKYNIMEKQALALIKSIKDFKLYILYSHIIAYVPNSIVNEILTKNGPEGKRGKWIATILEYDIEIKPIKLINFQGLAKLMAK